MKLLYIKIIGYKNLKNIEINFKENDNLTMIIGNNGSGKSNILEAISAIFSNIYFNTSLDFKFAIEYEINGKEIRISSLRKETKYLVNQKTISRKNYLIKNGYVPSNVIAL